MSAVLTDLHVRLYSDSDEAAVLALLSASLGDAPAATPGFFRWKHVANPFGRSVMLVAEADGVIVGFRALMRWEFVANGASLRAVRAVDTATHPEHQRAGIFSLLTRHAIEGLTGEADFVFNTPNEKSLPGYLKLGWQVVGRLPVHLGVRRPIRFMSRLRTLRKRSDLPATGPPVDAESAAEALRDAEGLSHLLAQSAATNALLRTPRGVDYLRWRYAMVPLLDYHVVREESGGDLVGLAIFRVRPRGELWESAVGEVFFRDGDSNIARRLMRRVARASRVDYLSACFLQDQPNSHPLRGARFVRAPTGPLLTVNVLGHQLKCDPTALRSWALTLGDIEVF